MSYFKIFFNETIRYFEYPGRMEEYVNSLTECTLLIKDEEDDTKILHEAVQVQPILLKHSCASVPGDNIAFLDAYKEGEIFCWYDIRDKIVYACSEGRARLFLNSEVLLEKLFGTTEVYKEQEIDFLLKRDPQIVKAHLN